MKTKRISGLIILALLGVFVNGQVRQPHSLYFMETIPQISQMNPALQPRANGYLMLPSVNIDWISSLAVKDAFQQKGNKWHTPVEKQYDYASLRNSIGKNAAKFNFGTDIDIIGFGMRFGNGYFSFGISEHISGNFALPKDLSNISDNGFPNETAFDFSPLRSQSIVYKQFLVGYSHNLNDRLTVGMNIKPLFGQIAVATDIQKINMYTGEKQWDINTKGNVYSSLPCDVIMNEDGRIHHVKFRYDELEDFSFDDGFQDYGRAFRNPGIAFDLGASYRIDDRITASVSLNNLGFISWKEDLNSMSFNGQYKFNGLFYDITTDDEIEDLFLNLLDSIADAMEYKVGHARFKTVLPPVLHAGASYRFSEWGSAGLLSRSVFWKNCMRQSFNLSLYLQPYSFVAFNTGVTWQVKGNAYLGGGLTFFLGPLQFYFLLDNAPIFYSTLRIDSGDDIGTEIPYVPERLKTVTARTGLNLVFGKHGYANKPMLDRRKSSWN